MTGIRTRPQLACGLPASLHPRRSALSKPDPRALSPHALRRAPLGPSRPGLGRRNVPSQRRSLVRRPDFGAMSSSTSRNPRRAHNRSRTRADPSPIPAVKARASRPPAEAAIPATAPARWCSITSRASKARGSPDCARRSTSIIPPLPPASPSTPESKLRARSSESTLRYPSRSTYRSAPGSIDPERVVIGTPSSGVKPIVVSTDLPERTAVTDEPPPRWQTTSRSTGRPRSSGTRCAHHSTERPWNPYRRMPQSSSQDRGTA